MISSVNFLHRIYSVTLLAVLDMQAQRSHNKRLEEGLPLCACLLALPHLACMQHEFKQLYDSQDTKDFHLQSEKKSFFITKQTNDFKIIIIIIISQAKHHHRSLPIQCIFPLI